MLIARVYVALFPLALYLLAVGVVNSQRRPVLTTGTWDQAALAFGLSGLVLVGPLQLILKSLKWMLVAPSAPILLVGIFISGAAVLILSQPRRLVIYNFDARQMREDLIGMLRSIDPEAVLAGSRMMLPRLGLEIQIEAFPALRNVSLIAGSELVNEPNWRLLKQRLRDQLAEVEVAPGLVGQGFVAASGVFLFAPLWFVVRDPAGIAQAFLRILQFNFQ
jgi:hypothetical protein